MRKVLITAILVWSIGGCMKDIYAAGPEIPRSVRVRILSNHQVSEVVVRAEGGLFGVGDATQCDGGRMTFTLKNGNVEVVWSGGKTHTQFAVIRSGNIELSFTKNGRRERRIYRGEMEISPSSGELLIINETALECYVHESAVAELDELPSKLSVSARRELVAAMEIVIRSYLVREGRRHEGGYQFCDLTHCVHFPGVIDGGASLSGGVLLLDGSKPVDAVFHSTCGGVLAGMDSYWEGSHEGETFRRGRDSADGIDLCAGSPHAKWKARISPAQMARIIEKNVTSMKCEHKDGRVVALACVNDHENFRIPVSRFLSRAGRMLGWNVIKSNCFDVNKDGDMWIFDGRGLGHGVGMCQYGAARLAALGKNRKEILAFYYPGARLYP